MDRSTSSSILIIHDGGNDNIYAKKQTRCIMKTTLMKTTLNENLHLERFPTLFDIFQCYAGLDAQGVEDALRVEIQINRTGKISYFSLIHD